MFARLHDLASWLSLERNLAFTLCLYYSQFYISCLELHAVSGDWLQGPYIYRLYHSYGFKEGEIAVLFLVGYLSSSTFGTFTGPMADKYGRRKMARVFGILYSIVCFIKLSQNFWVLFAGRVIGIFLFETHLGS